MKIVSRSLALAALALAACEGSEGPAGPAGQDGTNGTNGTDGVDGSNGTDGSDGTNGTDGSDGADGADGNDGTDGTDGQDGEDALATLSPRSGVVAMTLEPWNPSADLPTYVKGLVDQVDAGTLDSWTQFPLAAASTDTVRTIEGVGSNVVVTWLDPLGWKDDASAPTFGANNDYIAYFGDDWDATAGDPPQFHGDGTSGWMWVNHEYVSGSVPSPTSAPDGQNLLLARWLDIHELLDNDVESDIWATPELDTFVAWSKKQVGGSWMRVVQDPGTREWHVDRSAANLRYDATSDTRVRITGTALSGDDHDDAGAALPSGVVSGIMGDCSGGQTPWGTIFSAEENVQDYFGDLESCWSSNQAFLVGQGCDPGADLALDTTPSTGGAFGGHSDPNQLHARDLYGYLVEIDPGQAAGEYYGKTTAGVGHQKLGALGRARWENATFAVDGDHELVDGQPIVIYGGNDRRGGGIYKFVTKDAYQDTMSKAEIRDLLSEGTIYAAHFADLDNETGNTVGGATPTSESPGTGTWIALTVDNDDQEAPNAATLGSGTTVGDALQDQTWNQIAGFPTDDAVRSALWTASMKVGIRELNRPEDLEFNPTDGRIYVAFTNHTGQIALDEDGVLYDPATHSTTSPKRADKYGSIFTIEESGSPATSTSFTFWSVWTGSGGTDDYDAANPDNLLIDADGGLWFGTDGNFGTNKHADAFYYLDLDPGHLVTYGLAFRVAAMPSDAENTGPAISSDSRSMFFSVQHPGESQLSSWPQ